MGMLVVVAIGLIGCILAGLLLSELVVIAGFRVSKSCRWEPVPTRSPRHHRRCRRARSGRAHPKAV